MNKLLRWIGVGALALPVLLGGLFGIAWWKSERDLATVHVVADPPLLAAAAAEVAGAGRHLFVTRGCADCHQPDGRGKLLFDAGPLIRVTVPNITPAGLQGRYDLDALGRAIRHGIRPDGTPLVFMPAGDYSEMSDRDTALLAGYVLTLPPVAHDPEPLEVRPLGRVLHLLGVFPLVPAADVDHSPRPRHAPEAAPTPQYGFYVAQVCTGCHGEDFAGLKIGPASAPRASDLRPGGAMADWSEADFVRAMRQGVRPDGSTLDPFMPWKAMGQMTDAELGALWAYFATLPPAV